MKSKSIIENIWNGRKKYYSNHGEDLWKKIETDVYSKNYCGVFRTAKKFDLHVPTLKKTTHTPQTNHQAYNQ